MSADTAAERAIVSKLAKGSLVSRLLGAGRQPLKLLAQRHDVVAVTVDDPSEQVLPDLGLARFIDPETGQTLDVDTSDPEVRARFAAAVEEELGARRHLLRRLAIDEIPIHTDGGVVDPLIKFFRAREPRSRRR